MSRPLLSNEQLHDIAIAKQLYLERAKLGFAILAEKELRNYVKTLMAEIGPRIMRSDFATMSLGTMRTLLREFREVDGIARSEFKKQINALLAGFITAEVELQTELWDEGEEETALPTVEEKARITSQIMSRPITLEGKSVRDMVDQFSISIMLAGESHIKAGIAMRRPSSEVYRELQQLDVLKNAALISVVYTAIQNAAHVIGDKTALSPKYIWISVLDSRTTDICIGLNGRVFQRGKGPLPPAHRRCRSTTSPWYDGRGTVPKVSLGQWLKAQPGILNRRDLMSSKPITVQEYVKKTKQYGTKTKNLQT
jgi:SPP1 gp7 family putative phage head morphogenesis protein